MTGRLQQLPIAGSRQRDSQHNSQHNSPRDLSSLEMALY